ncbi:Lin1244/Lin1753 domain-containing protein [Sediminicola arcticus]|uniref:Lin1244/Lin1753 domain-containing protein n=1 Tax=Sediminicola arcticus TaxID=1574308 RepID=A0ABV2SSD0_9FLAO
MSKFKNQYFNHDFNAFNDTKIQHLIYKKGYEGYGIYWRIIEMMHTNEGKIENDLERLSFTLNAPKELTSAIINDFGLFITDDEYIISNRVIEQLDTIKGKSEKAKESANKRWKKDETKKPTNEIENSVITNEGFDEDALRKKWISYFTDKNGSLDSFNYSFIDEQVEKEKMKYNRAS